MRPGTAWHGELTGLPGRHRTPMPTGRPTIFSLALRTHYADIAQASPFRFLPIPPSRQTENLYQQDMPLLARLTSANGVAMHPTHTLPALAIHRVRAYHHPIPSPTGTGSKPAFQASVIDIVETGAAQMVKYMIFLLCNEIPLT
jgi:hypothetical protein